MKKNYSAPTLFNMSTMKLLSASHGNNSLLLESRLEDFTGLVALSGAMRLVIGLKDIGNKGASLTKKKF